MKKTMNPNNSPRRNPPRRPADDAERKSDQDLAREDKFRKLDRRRASIRFPTRPTATHTVTEIVAAYAAP